MGDGGGRDGRFWPSFWLVWLVAMGTLVRSLFSLAAYIWAPLPPGIPPDQPRCGQGEGMAFFLFLPGLGVLALLTVSPAVVALLRRQVRRSPPRPPRPPAWPWSYPAEGDGPRTR